MKQTHNKKGLIVIGGGLTGLSTGLTWALNQDLKENPVLIIEKEPKTGGYVTSYEREGFIFDTCQMIPNLSDILGYLGIDIDLKKFKGYYMRIFLVNPDTDEVKIIELPSGVETFKKWLMETYPREADQIEKFLDYSRSMYLELFDLKVEMGIVDKETYRPLVQKAFREGLALLIDLPVFIEDMQDEYIKKAIRDANTVNAIIFGEVRTSKPEKVVEKEAKVEEKEEEKEEEVGIGGLFG